MKYNILYDFKRSFLRVSVLSFLVLFVIAGVALTYEFLHSIPPAEFNDVNVAVTVENTDAGYHFLGLVFDNYGNPISNAKVIAYSNSTEKVYYTNSSGYFSFYGKPTKIVVTYNGQQKSLILIGALVTYSGPSSSLTEYLFHYQPSYVNVSDFYNSISFFNDVIIGYNGHTAKVIALVPNVTLCFYKKFTFPGTQTPNTNLLGKVTIHQPLKFSTITIPKGTSVIYSTSEFAGSTDQFLPIPLLETELLSSIATGTFSIFSFVFTIVFIYVAYQMFGKLKDKGLSLLLARPITRGEVYFTRYFSGIIALVIATLIFSLATSATLAKFSGVFPSYDALIFFAFAILNVITWYSLSYLIFSKFSSTTGLGLSIGTYFVLGFLLSFLALALPKNAVYYFLPTSFASSLLYYSINASYPINPAISALVEALWIVIPVAVGYLLFKRIDV